MKAIVKPAMTANLNTRVDEKTGKQFKRRCINNKRHYSEVLRELVKAYTEGRILITNEKDHEESYK